MNALLKNFDLIADIPGAIPKLRQLILDLALRGKLVEQDPKDEPASELLKKIEAEKRRLVQAGEIKAPKPTAPITEEEMPYEIINGWRWIKLGDIAEIIRGVTYSKNQATSNREIECIELLRANNINIEINYDDTYFIPKTLVNDNQILRVGDLLIAMSSGSANLVGKAAPIKINRECTFGAFCGCIRSHSKLVFDFINLFSQSPLYRDQTQLGGKGIGIQNLNKEFLENIKLPLPPLAEQKRIVAKVDELMAICDQLEAQQAERAERHAVLNRAALTRFRDEPTPENLRLLFHPDFPLSPSDLRKTILDLAVRGKLVEQDAGDEPAADLLKNIAAEKTKLIARNEFKLDSISDPISTDEFLFDIPEKWKWIRICDLCRPISSGATPEQNLFHPSKGVPYLKVYNIRNQKIDFEYRPQFIDQKHHSEKMRRSKLVPGDIVMNIVGPPLGKVAIIPNTFPEWNCNQAISFFRLILPSMAPYIYNFLKEGSFLNNIQLIGTAGQDNISVTKCKFIPIPLPPLAEQKRIVARVNELMALVDELEQQIITGRTQAEQLIEAITRSK